jgi:hypothetical protein
LAPDPLNSPPKVKVVADGQSAKESFDLSEVKQRGIMSLLKLPLAILGIGLVITAVVGFFVVLEKNPKLRKAVMLILKEMNPTLSTIVDTLRSVS